MFESLLCSHSFSFRLIKRKNRYTTTFLVSQRIAGIRQADQILVLGNGTLEGNGTHDVLMKTCEVYREIYFSQFPEERAAYNNESGVIA